MTFGRFSGIPTTQWLSGDGPDRDMKLISDFWYEDPDGRRWDAPQGSIVNGASIPEELWSSVGSPYTGDYRRASIVHDVARSSDDIPRKDSDRMFYHACLAGGCSKFQAKLLYAGVRIGDWASGLGLLEAPLDQNSIKPRLANEHTRKELVVRAKYTVLADRLMTTPDDLESIEAVTDAELQK